MSRPQWPNDARQYRWIIDGHNVIFADPSLAALQRSDKQNEARRLLEAMLDRLAATRGLRIVVVYDGSKTDRSPGGGAQGRVMSVFSRPPDESADDTIVRIANQSVQKGEKVAVVTSDRALGRRLPAGAVCPEPSELFAKLSERSESDEPETPEGDFSDIEEHFLGLDEENRDGSGERSQEPPPSSDRGTEAIDKKKARGLRKQKRRLEQPRRKKRRLH